MIAGQPTLVLDVAHNPHAVAALTHSLDQMGFFPRTHAVFGVMADKDVAAIVARIAPIVDAWYVCDLPTLRAARASQLVEQLVEHLAALSANGDRRAAMATVKPYASPSAALDAAAAAADPVDRIVVFGSFYTVGGVLAHGLPQRRGAATEPTPQAGSSPVD